MWWNTLLQAARYVPPALALQKSVPALPSLLIRGNGHPRQANRERSSWEPLELKPLDPVSRTAKSNLTAFRFSLLASEKSLWLVRICTLLFLFLGKRGYVHARNARLEGQPCSSPSQLGVVLRHIFNKKDMREILRYEQPDS
jgi:hypothetical protein